MFTNTVFKSEESRDAIRTRYNQILSAFPFAKRYAETAFGRTFILEAGAEGNPPLILLHGSCSNSAFWFADISALSASFHVLAVDIPGEAGNSEENRLDLASDDYADWLREVFRACGIEKAVVMGNSLGSWMALRFAVKYPQSIAKLILIAPSGLSLQNTAFLIKAKNALTGKEKLAMDPAVAPGIELPREVKEFIDLIIGGYHPISEELPVFRDEQLKKLTMPVLFVAGENDVMVDAVSAAERLRALIPAAEIHLLKKTGHLIANTLEYTIPFLSK